MQRRYSPETIANVQETMASEKQRIQDTLAAVRDDVSPLAAKALDVLSDEAITMLIQSDPIFVCMVHSKLTLHLCEAVLAGNASDELLARITK